MVALIDTLSNDETLLLVVLIVVVILSFLLLIVLILQRYREHFKSAFHHRNIAIVVKRLRSLFLPNKEETHERLFPELVDPDELQQPLAVPLEDDLEDDVEEKVREEEQVTQKNKEIVKEEQKGTHTQSRMALPPRRKSRGKKDTVITSLKKAYA